VGRLALHAQQLFAPRLGREIRRLDQFQPLGAGELLGAGAHEEHMLAVLHDLARRQHRVAHARDIGDGAAAQRGAIHDGGVQLMGARAGEHAAMARIEQRAVLQQAHRFGHRVERAAAGGQHGLAGRQNAVQGGQELLLFLGRHGGARHGARATVDRDNRLKHLFPAPTPWMIHGMTDWVTPAAAWIEFLARWATAADSPSTSPSAPVSELAEAWRDVWAYSATVARGASGEVGLSVSTSTGTPACCAARPSVTVS